MWKKEGRNSSLDCFSIRIDPPTSPFLSPDERERKRLTVRRVSLSLSFLLSLLFLPHPRLISGLDLSIPTLSTPRRPFLSSFFSSSLVFFSDEVKSSPPSLILRKVLQQKTGEKGGEESKRKRDEERKALA